MTDEKGGIIKRKWYRLHPASWIVALIWGGTLFYFCFIHLFFEYKKYEDISFRGWPLQYMSCTVILHCGMMQELFCWSSLVCDIIVWLFCTASPLLISERLSRQHFQYSLSALFILITAFAIPFSLFTPRWQPDDIFFTYWRFAFQNIFCCAIGFLIFLVLWMGGDYLSARIAKKRDGRNRQSGQN
jgi:hypothetical protein